MTRSERIAAIKHWRGCEMLEQPFFSIKCGSTSMDTTSFGELIDFLLGEISRLETALSGRTHHHSDEDIERELNEAEDRIIELEQRLASKEDALAAAMLVIDAVKTDTRHLAEAVIGSHREIRWMTYAGKMPPCTCPVCQTARRVICQNSDT